MAQQESTNISEHVKLGLRMKMNRGELVGFNKCYGYRFDVLQGKTYTADPISHKRYINRGEADKYYISNHHEPIISPDEFDLVQDLIKSRSGARVTGRRVGNISRKYAFSSRIRCGYCGNCYVRSYMFSWCTNLKNVIIPDSVISIGEYAFEYCTNVTQISVKDETQKQLVINSNSGVAEDIIKPRT